MKRFVEAVSTERFIPVKNVPMTSNRAFIVDCRIESDVDERELARREFSDEMQLSEMTPAEHACSKSRSSNVGKLSWTADLAEITQRESW